MPAAIAVPALISAGSSIISGVIGSRAAKDAANTQNQAAQQVSQQYQQSAQQSGQQVVDAANAAGQRMIDASGQAGQQVVDAAGNAASGINQATQQGVAGSQQAVGSANDLLSQLYGQSSGYTDPYRQAGAGAVNSLAGLLGPNGEFMQQFKFDPNQDPGYQFRLEQGQKALERSAAARGGLQGGGTLKALERYAQGVASDEYGKSFERFQSDRKNRFGMLSDLAGVGQRAVGQQLEAANAYGTGTSRNLMQGAEFAGELGVRGATAAGDVGFRGAQQAGVFTTNAARSAGDWSTNAARAAGDYRMEGTRGSTEAQLGGANAMAAGRIGSANAWASTISNVGRTAADAYGRYNGVSPASSALDRVSNKSAGNRNLRTGRLLYGYGNNGGGY